MKKSLLGITTLTSALALLGATSSARAQAIWQGTQSTNWFDANNWSPAQVPTNGTATISINTTTPNPTVVGVNPAPGTNNATANALFVASGTNSTGMLTIENGGRLDASTVVAIGQASGSQGTVTVSGAGSIITAPTFLLGGGAGGVATLNINNGAEAIAATATSVGQAAGGTGTVNITGGGILQTPSLTGGAGTAVGSFNGGTLVATTNNPTFISGFTGPGDSLTIGSGGLTINSGTSNIATDGSAFSGAGGLTKMGGGTLTLNGTNTYTGPTAVNQGTLQAGINNAFSPTSAHTIGTGATLDLNNHNETIGSLAGAGNVTLGSGTLTAGGNNTSTTFSGVISGSGGLTKVGTGIFILSGNNAFTGALIDTAGTLQVDGSTVSPVTIQAGAILDGIGTVGPTTIQTGGTLAPGNSTNPTGTLTVNGNLVFNNGATYRVQVTPAAASSTNVMGTATLNGTVNAVFAPGSYVTKEYLILQSQGLVGTFSGLTNTNLPAGFTASLRDTNTDVFLDLTARLAALTGTFNVNQQNVANGINNFFNSGGALPPGFANLFSLSGAPLANALTQLSGEVGTGAERSAFNLMTQFLNLMTDPYAVGFAPQPQPQPQPGYVKAPRYLKAPPAPPPLEPHWTAWGAGFGGVNHADGDAVIGSHNIRASDWGFAAGMDYHFSPDTLLGFALAGAGTNWDLTEGLGTGRSDAFMAGVHGTTHFGPAYLTGAFGFANHWFTIDRTSFDSDQLRSTFDGQSYGLRFEAGDRFAVPFTLPITGAAVNFTPYVAVQSQWFHSPTYSETDLTGGGFGLTYDAMTANDTRSELGARFDSLTTFYGNPLILRSRIAWAHDWVDTPALNASFQALPGSAFTVFGAPIPHNSALTTTSAELHFATNWSFTAKFDGEFASGSQVYAGTGTLRYTW